MMGGSIKHTDRFATAFYFTVFFLFSSAGLAGVPPGVEDVNIPAEMARLTVDSFMQESFELRMRYEFNGKFAVREDKENLQKLAKRAGDHLQAIAEEQQRLKSKIEDYQGEDWDDRYGSTGLWRKLSNGLYITNLSKCEIDYYLALAADEPQQSKILRGILTQINSLDKIRGTAYLKFLKAKTLTLLAQTNPAYKLSAKKEFDTLRGRSDMRHSTVFKIAMEEIKLSGETEHRQLDKLANELAQTSCKDDIELVLPLVFGQRRLNQPEAFERTVKLFPQTEDILGSLILSALSCQRQDVQKISIFEAELAVQAVWRNETKDYRKLLDDFLAEKKFQTPLIFYVAAVKFADSAPAKAVGLLIEASKLQKIQKSEMLEVSAEEIAKQAGQLAYNLFVQDSGCRAIALKAFENYSAIAGDKIDEELEYLYSVILDDCGEAGKAEELLEKIAKRPDGKWRNRARLELTARAVQQKQYENPKAKSRLLEQLSSLIVDNNDCKYANEAMELLSAVIDEIDKAQAQTDNLNKMAKDCKVLAEFCFDCLDGPARRQGGLYLAEAAIFVAKKEQEKLSAVEKLLNDITKSSNGDVDFIRCWARLLAEQGKYNKAAELWAQVAQMRRRQAPAVNQRSWKWWRAKFYELYCWSKCPQTQKEEVLHTIEVLENSFDDIPTLWAEKLSLLKEEIK